MAESRPCKIITHRLSSVRQANKILVLKDGEVEGFESHEFLMKNDKYYKELYEMQSSLYYKEPDFRFWNPVLFIKFIISL